MDEETKKPGCLWPAAWLILGLLGTIAGVAAIALGGMSSESLGVTITQAAAFPLGVLWFGGFIALITYFMKKAGGGVRYGAPLGCGCLGGILMVVLVWVFFGFVWQML
jgi:hypothetical protein